MARIEVEESALESIKAMNQRLQEERDELLEGLRGAALRLRRGTHLETQIAHETLLTAAPLLPR